MNSKQPKVRRSFVDEMIPAPVYKRFQVKDRYNQMVLTSGKQGLVVRAYDDGIAYRLTYKSNIPYTTNKLILHFPPIIRCTLAM